MKKTSLLLFAVITAIIFNSCSKDETKTSNFTGYYNSKSIYQNDLLLRIVSATGTSSFFGTGTETDLTINTNLFVSKTTGIKTITRINKTLDSIRVYELEKPELGGLLYVIKNNTVSVHQFEFVGTKNKINTTYHYTTLPIPAGRYNSSNTNEDGTEGIDKAIDDFYKFTQTLGLYGVLKAIKESVSNEKEDEIKNWENTQQSRNELSDYKNKQVDKNPEPIKVPLEEDPINQDEQKVIDDTIEEPFDCNTSTLAMTISDPNISNGVGTVTANGIGGEGNYNYKWSDGQGGNYAAFSKSGTYIVTVTDANGCSISSSVIIKIEPDCTQSTLAVTTTATSNSAAATAKGGEPPYTYLWSNGSTNSSINNVAKGTYSVTATDAAGCKKLETVSIDSELVVGQNYQGGIIAYIFQIGDSQYVAGETHGVIISSTLQSTAENWQSAMTLCNNLNLNGYSDWVLPTPRYFESYVYSRYGGLKFWTSQELVGPDGVPSSVDMAVLIDTTPGGGSFYELKSRTNAVIAIRYF